jgi:hypothetical protein
LRAQMAQLPLSKPAREVNHQIRKRRRSSAVLRPASKPWIRTGAWLRWPSRQSSSNWSL